MSQKLNLSIMDSLLITGANGFVGQAIIQELGTLEQENLPSEIILVTRNGLNVELPLSLRDITCVVSQDLTKPWNISYQSSHVINLAADGSHSPYSKEASDSFVLIGRNLINWLKTLDCQVSVFHASSGACFDYVDSNTSQYLSGGKAEFIKGRIQVEEDLSREFSDNDLKLSIGRLFTFSGNLLLQKNQYAITEFIKSGLSERLIKVKGNAETVRSYLHEDAMAHWILRATINPVELNPLQIGSNQPVTIKELAEYVAEITGAEVTYAPTSQPPDIYLPNNEETRSSLGVSEGTTWKIAVQEMIDSVRMLADGKD
jgi:nucleoside-diphosphate-sugar epimerase